MADSFAGVGRPLSQNGLDPALTQLGVEPPSLWALLTVETRGFGFLPDRRPKILFERHIFHQRTDGRFDAQDPDISAETPGGYSGGGAEYERLARAIGLDRKAALESASWGLPQIMGFNAASLGYAGTDQMIEQFLDGEDNQLDGAVRFLSGNAALLNAFRQRKWDTVARHYNGPSYATHGYHTRLARYHALYTANGTPDLSLRAAQARLTYLGFDPNGVDGVMGDGTRRALRSFQVSVGLAETGALDAETAVRLTAAANV